MRLLHPDTLKIVALKCKDDDFINATVSRKTIIAHAWVEQFKFLASGQMHPKCFITDHSDLGKYLYLVKHYGDIVGCNLNIENLMKHDLVYIGYCSTDFGRSLYELDVYFDSHYLFSDAVSLYLKGLNIFQYIYGEVWEQYCPIINLKEIKRIVGKTLKNEDEEIR